MPKLRPIIDLNRPVCIQSLYFGTVGLPVKIINKSFPGRCPILGQYTDRNGMISYGSWDKRGVSFYLGDLVNVKYETEKWVNLYPDGEIAWKDTREEADRGAGIERIGRIKVMLTEGQFDTE